MDQRRFYERLDALFGEKKLKEAGRWLESCRRKAEEENDREALLAVLNEEVGYCRSIGKAGEACGLFRRALALAEELGLAGTGGYATTLLNGATACRAAGDYEEAARLYQEARQAYEKAGMAGSYEAASLLNNESLLLEKMGRTEEARQCLVQALQVLEKLPDTGAERAVSLTNLGLLWAKDGQTVQAREYLEEARRLFQEEESRTGRSDAHFGAALAGMAQVSFQEGKYQEAEAWYEEACRETKESFGENDSYRLLRENLEEARRRQRKAPGREEERLLPDGEPGFAEEAVLGREPAPGGCMGVCREYYRSCGQAVLQERFPGLFPRMTIGLAGYGSECFGYDDQLSSDHDYGPSFAVWLDREDYARYGRAVQEAYDSLPKSFGGLGARQISAHGEGRVGACCTQDFYQELLGLEQGPQTEGQWLELRDEQLAAACSGQVFQEGEGSFLAVRRRLLAYYPRRVWLQKIALQAALMAQAGQYNYPRLMMRRDPVGASLALAEFTKAAAAMCYLLNRRYMPYYKWIFRGMQELGCLSDVAGYLEELALQPAQAEAWDGMTAEEYRRFLNVKDYRVVYIETVCRRVREELKSQGLSACPDPFLENHTGEILSHMEKR